MNLTIRLQVRLDREALEAEAVLRGLRLDEVVGELRQRLGFELIAATSFV
jgi:hypothetical protein